jgi:glycerol-3-phosphate acyltransferase PlsX
VACDQRIEMGEKPGVALLEKPKNTISEGLKALAENKLSVFASAGHSGVVIRAALQYLHKEKDIIRPAALAPLPHLDGGSSFLVDAGLNADCPPAQLLEFAHMGLRFYQQNWPDQTVQVGLINTGTETGKGNRFSQEAHQLLAQKLGEKFYGNVESRAIFKSPARVLLSDGFTGNLLLKLAESFFDTGQELNFSHPFLDGLSYRKLGGTPLLGLREKVVLGHGAADAETIKNLILTAESIGLANFANRISGI